MLIVKALEGAERSLWAAAAGDVRAFMASSPVDDLSDNKACA